MIGNWDKELDFSLKSPLNFSLKWALLPPRDTALHFPAAVPSHDLYAEIHNWRWMKNFLQHRKIFRICWCRWIIIILLSFVILHHMAANLQLQLQISTFLSPCQNCDCQFLSLLLRNSAKSSIAFATPPAVIGLHAKDRGDEKQE